MDFPVLEKSDYDQIYNGEKILHAPQLIDIPYIDDEEKNKKKPKAKKVAPNPHPPKNVNRVDYDDDINADDIDDDIDTDKEAKDNYEILTEGGRMEAFWNIIDRFKWKLRSDVALTSHDVTKITNKFSAIDKIVFTHIYPEVMKNIKEILSGLLEIKNLTDEQKNESVSHIVAMGQQWHNNLMESPDLAEFLLSDGEVQNFHSNLSKDLLENFTDDI